MKALALLVESGTIYCILLVRVPAWACQVERTADSEPPQILVLVYEASPALFASPDVHQNGFLRAIADYTYACFVPVIVSVLSWHLCVPVAALS